MAMTKAEKAIVAELENEIDKLKMMLSLRATNDVEPDIEKPGSGMTYGFTVIAGSTAYGRVVNACSSTVSHGWNEYGECTQTSSQGGIPLFSSRILALKALRRETEIECARRLYMIDKMIEAEELE